MRRRWERWGGDGRDGEKMGEKGRGWEGEEISESLEVMRKGIGVRENQRKVRKTEDKRTECRDCH